MLPTISIGPVVIPTNGLVIIVGIWIALTVVERAARKLGLDAEKTYTLMAISLASGFIGARLVFVVLHWDAFKVNLSGIVWPLTSGYDMWGGLLFAIGAGFFYGRAKQLPAAETLDALAPGIVSALFAVSLSDLLAGPGYGMESAVPWALDLYGIKRHPVQVYELLVAAASLAVWWLAYSRRLFAGQLFLLTALIYSSGRLFVEAFRANSWATSGGIRLIQVISLAILLVTLFLLARRLTRANEDLPSVLEKPAE